MKSLIKPKQKTYKILFKDSTREFIQADNFIDLCSKVIRKYGSYKDYREIVGAWKIKKKEL